MHFVLLFIILCAAVGAFVMFPEFRSGCLGILGVIGVGFIVIVGGISLLVLLLYIGS